MQLMPDDAERDFRGYGATPPHPRWPGGARVAININLNLNYEAGGEHSLLEGDSASEGMLNDIGFPAYEGVRSPIVESAFEYGSRCGVWRRLRIFARFDIAVSILAVVRALSMAASSTTVTPWRTNCLIGWRSAASPISSCPIRSR
jgi:allantoinase